MRIFSCLLFGILLPLIATAQQPAAAPWRSALYPEDWKPGFTDAQGRFLHDFSYAGYHAGEKLLPELKDNIIDVTKSPYEADITGTKDSTAPIQAALDAAAKSGGGVVFMPAGTYRIAPPEGKTFALQLKSNHTVLRGAGADKTFLFNDSVEMKGKNVILLEAEKAMNWRNEGNGAPSSLLTKDLPNRATEAFVQDVKGFAPGDLFVLRSDLTQRFIDSVEMNGKWQPAGATSPNLTLIFFRRVVAVKPETSSVTFDVPVRYPLVMADAARIVKMIDQPLSESGLEDFSIGMRQHPGEGTGDEDYTKPGTLAEAIHGSRAITFRNAENCWAKGLSTYAPTGNDSKIHVLSNCLALVRCRFVTVTGCDFKFPQYRGGGGNGYLYTLQSQECLLINNKAEGGRHNYDFGLMCSSGNVITQCQAKDGRLASDFHMFLSMSNLLDNITCEGDFLEARYFRPWGGTPVHGVTTTQTVFWNNNGLRYSREKPVLIWSQQLGDGYVIGTRGPDSIVDSDDFVEGIGQGDSLQPASLYADQKERRLKK